MPVLVGLGFGFFLGFLAAGLGAVEVGVVVMTAFCVFEVEEEPQPASTPAARMPSAAPVRHVLIISGNDDAGRGKYFPGTMLARCTSAS